MLTTFKNNFQGRFSEISFKTKAISLAAILSLLPVLGVGALAYVVSFNSLKASEQTAQEAATTSLADSLSRFILLRGKDIQTLADLSQFSDPKAFKAITPAEHENFLSDYMERYKIYDSISIFDLAGNPILVDKNTNRENHFNRDYFQLTLKTGKPQISKVELSKTTKKSSIYFTAPIKDNLTGQVTGIIRARMPVTVLKDIADNYGEWHVIDKNTDKLILATDQNEVGMDANNFPNYVQLKNSKKATSTTGIEKGNNKNLLASFINLSSREELAQLNLGVAIDTEISVIAAKERGVVLVLVLGMLGAGGTTVAASLLLSNRVGNYIKGMAQTISNSSTAIVDTVEMQELTVNMQANSAIETSNTVNDLGAISFQSAAQAEASATGASLALALAEEGTKSVQQTLQGMDSLREKVDNIAQQIVNLSEQTGQITVVSDLVADLASQTNMLALNAAVEAARAGEQGKGFSVVASEIRKLADQSKKSADKINALANDIQAAINRTVMVTDEGTKTVQEGIDLAEGTATTFLGVTEAVNKVFINSQQISTSAKQQAVAIQQVLNSMTNISQGSQESAVGMHQVKMTTRELTQVADELKAAVV